MQTVTVQFQHTKADRYGDRETDGDPFDVERCIVVPRDSLEGGEHAVQVTRHKTIYAQSETDVTATDWAFLDGETWSVDGQPEYFEDPITTGGDLSHTTIEVKKVTG